MDNCKAQKSKNNSGYSEKCHLSHIYSCTYSFLIRKKSVRVIKFNMIVNELGSHFSHTQLEIWVPVCGGVGHMAWCKVQFWSLLDITL